MSCTRSSDSARARDVAAQLLQPAALAAYEQRLAARAAELDQRDADLRRREANLNRRQAELAGAIEAARATGGGD